MKDVIESIRKEKRLALLYELFRLDINEMVTYGIMSTARISSVEDYQSISPTVEIITVENNACNDGVDTIQLEDFPNLRLLRVKSNSFYRVKTVSIANLPKLETVVVDSNCFAPRSLQYGEYSNLPKNSLALCHCPLLRVLIIGEKSFSSYTQCTLSDLPSLQRVEIGRMDTAGTSCFYKASLVLQSKKRSCFDEQTFRA